MYGGNPLIFDIETVPDRFDDYSQAFPKSKKKPGLHAIISRVVAIGYEVDGHRKAIAGDEPAMMGEFDDLLKEHRTSTIVGFNIKNFDIPVLRMRAAKHGIKLDFPDRRSQRICDLFEILGGKWQTDVSACSLRELIWYFYGETASTHSGADVAEMWKRGDMAGICDHCLEDVEFLRRLYDDFGRFLF